MIGTIISLLGGVKDGIDLYSKVSTIFSGDKTKQCLYEISSNINKMSTHIERLSDKILYATDLHTISDINKDKKKYTENLRNIRELLEPVQCAIGDDIISSAVIYAPDKMKNSMVKNPWEVLENITPISFVQPQLNPNKIPFLFNHGSTNYIGWQMKGIMPLLFDCTYDEAQTMYKFNKNNLYVLDESLGIESLGGINTTILHRDMKLPLNHKQVFSTASDNQTSVTICIYPGNDEEKVDQNKLIGKFDLLNIPPAPRGVPQIEVSFQVDFKGVLTASARDLGTGNYISKTFDNIKVKKITVEIDKFISLCPKCNKLFRLPFYLKLNVTCPYCKSKYFVVNGNINN